MERKGNMRDRFDINQVIKITGLGIRAEQADGGADFDVACQIAVKKLWKIKEYESLEEQNRLLKLPCAVGDELYLLLERNAGGFGIVKSKLVKYSISEKCEIFSAFYECKEIGNTIEFYRCDFGETVFLTKEAAEAAEAALKEMSE